MSEELNTPNTEPKRDDYGMPRARWQELMSNDELKLTTEEIKVGWHFCTEYDGLLCNENDSECKDCGCTCLKDEPKS